MQQQSRVGLTREETNKALNLIKLLERHSDSYEFRHPVDYLGLGLPDYPDVIKVPMDLSKVKKNLKSEEYPSVQDFLLDVQLIWDNCKLYNPQESVKTTQFIYQQAHRLQETVHSFCLANAIQIPTGKRRPKEPSISVQEKKETSDLVKQANINTLAHICSVVQQDCPEAFSSNNNRVVIDVEKLNYSTFNKVKE